ncbi:cytochrome c oxidase biogenesis protein Cmc1-like protein [Carex rostrata]
MGYLEEARQNHVKKKVEEALRSKMKAKALKECDVLCEKYAQCAYGRTISVIWRCRKEANDLNECLHQYTNDSVLEEMKKSYLLEQESKEKTKS